MLERTCSLIDLAYPRCMHRSRLTYQHAEKMLIQQANRPDILASGAEPVTKLGPTFMVSPALKTLRNRATVR